MVLYNLPLEKIAKVPKPTNKANQIGNRSACISICLQFPRGLVVLHGKRGGSLTA
jgi:hypothetical protein